MGDYTTLGAAVTGGAQSIFIRNGTYTESAISLSDGAFILGETAGAVILDFNNAAASLTADGNGGTKETAGTIAVTNGSTAVVGTGTTFTNLSAGDFILIGCHYYEIDTITDATNLDLVEAYEGRTLSGLSYQAHTVFRGVQFENIVIRNSMSTGLVLRGLLNSTLAHVEIYDTNLGVSITDCGDMRITNLASRTNVTDGMTVTDSYVINVLESKLFNNTQHGGQVVGTSNCVNFDSCSIDNNDDSGLNIGGTATGIHITGSSLSQNAVNGVVTAGTNSNVVIVSSTLSRNGNDGVSHAGTDNVVSSCVTESNGRHGILLAGNSSVVGCQVLSNTSDGINVGTANNTTIVNNVIVGNGARGVFTDGDDGIVSGNQSRTNTTFGIRLDTASQRNIVSSNNCRGNTSGAISNAGLSNVITGNVTLP